jgi:hypothetical protein
VGTRCFNSSCQFRKAPVRQLWISIELLGQAIELPAEHFQHAWGAVLCRAACSEQNVDAGAQSFW